MDRVLGTRVSSLPTIMFYKNRQKVAEVVGANVPQIEAHLRTFSANDTFQGEGHKVGAGGQGGVQPDPDLLEQLVDMGFDRRQAAAALIKTNNESIDDATAWMIEHSDSATENTTHPPPQPSEAAQSALASVLLATALAAQTGQAGSIQSEVGHGQSSASEGKKELSEAELAAQQRLQAKLKELKEEKDKEALLDQGRRKREEIETAKKIREQKEKWKQDERERAQREAEAERRADEQLKLDLKRKLEWDRKERMANLRPVGTVVDAPAIQPKPVASTHSAPQSNVCEIQIRLPNGTKLQTTFQPTDTLDDVYAYVMANRTDASNDPFVLMTSFPKQIFEGSAASITLRDAGLCPRGVLLVQRSFR